MRVVSLVLVVAVALIVGACVPSAATHQSVVVAYGKHAIALACEAPALDDEPSYKAPTVESCEAARKLLECEEQANSLCPWGFTRLYCGSYISYDPGIDGWGRLTRKTHHEGMVIECLVSSLDRP